MWVRKEMEGSFKAGATASFLCGGVTDTSSIIHVGGLGRAMRAELGQQLSGFDAECQMCAREQHTYAIAQKGGRNEPPFPPIL